MGCGAGLAGESASHSIPTAQGTFTAEVMDAACTFMLDTRKHFSLGLVQLELVTGEVEGSLPLQGLTQPDKVSSVLI